MPRLACLDAPGVLHHIMIRGIEPNEIYSKSRQKDELPRSKLRGIKNGYPILERSKLRGTDPKGRLERKREDCIVIGQLESWDTHWLIWQGSLV